MEYASEHMAQLRNRRPRVKVAYRDSRALWFKFYCPYNRGWALAAGHESAMYQARVCQAIHYNEAGA